MFMLGASAVTHDPEAVRETARRVLARDHFQLDPVGDSALGELIRRIIAAIFRPILRAFEALSAISPALAWMIVILLVLLLVAIVFHIIHTFRVALQRRSGIRRIDLEGRRVADPSELLKRAELAAKDGEFREAARLILRASLRRLELAEERPFRPGVTNREHLRRYRGSLVHGPLQFLVDLIDQTWYGDAECRAETVAPCREAYSEICRIVKERPRAHRA